jgi:hypothetical protein
MTTLTTAPDVTRCCGEPVRVVRAKRRCHGCGHRQAVNGLPPIETRALMKADPRHAVQIAWTELRDRRLARRAGGAA